MIKQQIGIPNINSVTHSEQAGKLAHDDGSDNGSDDGFDGFRIGLSGFENPMRDIGTEESLKQINQVTSKYNRKIIVLLSENEFNVSVSVSSLLHALLIDN